MSAPVVDTPSGWTFYCASRLEPPCFLTWLFTIHANAHAFTTRNTGMHTVNITATDDILSPGSYTTYCVVSATTVVVLVSTHTVSIMGMYTDVWFSASAKEQF